MNHSDFVIGRTFWCSGRQWQCTDIGTRVIVAMRIDGVETGSDAHERRRTLSRSEAETEGWFNGPPYAVAETVFDENGMEGCTVEAEEIRRLKEDQTGETLIAAVQASPHRDIEIERRRAAMPVREVGL